MKTKLNNQVEIPQVGFGVFQVPPHEAQATVELALQAGYRHIDTAAAYNNEKGVGDALKASGLPRDEVFITTKLRNGNHGTDETRRAYDDSRERLGVDVIDLYLIHWPNPTADLYVDSWRDMEALYREGAVRAIGVSNFLTPHLERLLNETEIVPVVNQIELHPSYQQRDLGDFVRKHGIAVEAYSPLGQGHDLSNEVITGIAAKYGTSSAQVILRWHLQNGHIVIPKSATPSRMASNLDVFGFELSAEETAGIDALDENNRLGGDPNTFSISQIR
jgi:diketogulonate reductase-like aldo/keto reductase